MGRHPPLKFPVSALVLNRLINTEARYEHLDCLMSLVQSVLDPNHQISRENPVNLVLQALLNF